EDGPIVGARTIARNRERVARSPVARDHARGRVGGADGLLETAQRADMEAKTGGCTGGPAEGIEIDRVALHGIDADVEREVLILVDAGRGRVALDLLGG